MSEQERDIIGSFTLVGVRTMYVGCRIKLMRRQVYENECEIIVVLVVLLREPHCDSDILPSVWNT